MGVLVAGVNEELLIHFTSQAILWQHAFDGSFDNSVGAAAEKIFRNLFFFSAGVPGEIDVDLVIHFVTGEDDLVSVDDDDKVAAVNVRRVIGLVFAPENGGNFGTHATYGLISTVHDVPVAVNGSLVRVFGGEMQFAHFLFFLREAIAIPMAVKIMDRKSRPF
jgi:hypothetical protein